MSSPNLQRCFWVNSLLVKLASSATTTACLKRARRSVVDVKSELSTALPISQATRAKSSSISSHKTWSQTKSSVSLFCFSKLYKKGCFEADKSKGIWTFQPLTKVHRLELLFFHSKLAPLYVDSQRFADSRPDSIIASTFCLRQISSSRRGKFRPRRNYSCY